MTNESKRTTFVVNEVLYRKLKAKLTLAGMSVTQWLRKKMREELNEF